MTANSGGIAQRIARFADLAPLPLQQDSTIPQNALDIVYARRLLPVIGLEDGSATVITNAAPIRGAGGITMTMATCPPGQGPDLHAHKRTFETFTVLAGRFEFRWGDAGEHAVELECFDVISVPPGAYRAFRNIGEQEGVLQVLISGGVHDGRDVVVPPRVTRELDAAAPGLRDVMAADGVTFLEG